MIALLYERHRVIVPGAASAENKANRLLREYETLKLRFKNICRFYDETEVRLDGITVIAGKNGLGKSTISKILYCVFNSFYNIDDQVREERIRAITELLIPMEGVKAVYRRNVLESAAERILEEQGALENVESLKDMLFEDGLNLDKMTSNDLESLKIDIEKVLRVTDEDIKNKVLEYRLEAEFGNQVKHLNHENERFEIKVEIKDADILIYGGEQISIEKQLSLSKSIIYLDDTSAARNFRGAAYSSFYSHEWDLNQRLRQKKYNKETIIRDILSEERYKRIADKINETHIGRLVENGKRDYEYTMEGLNGNVKLENISAGTKVLLTFKLLMENGYLEDNGILVLDEPEIHMHPEWQYILAEAIVLLNREYGINVLLSSHSADFIQFVEYFSIKYGMIEKCNYYLIEEGSEFGTSALHKVNQEKQRIFESLGMPFIRVTEEMDNEDGD